MFGCDGKEDSIPLVLQHFRCSFERLNTKDAVKVTVECQEDKSIEPFLSIDIGKEVYELEGNSIILSLDKIVAEEKNFNCIIKFFPYWIKSENGFKDMQEEWGSRKMTYILHIYNDNTQVYEKKLNYPEDNYKETIEVRF
ncbi:hypothetical protein C7377_1037 [Balneicella halophila]|uniref:Uncharacterized protein n=1 Tax=Balneicella halophila TaxID=1537566 RepID=A0A7L4UNX3_BALHA|nr:hypothetical protein [Balneicella halophila]PVX50724.1 hypothetical protein C7377_1037 [Balneicella halophila]